MKKRLNLVQTEHGIALYATSTSKACGIGLAKGELFTIHGLKVPRSKAGNHVTHLATLGTFENDDDFSDLLDGLIL